MKNILIVGARGYGREIVELVHDINTQSNRFTIKGFLDDKADALNDYPNYPPILGSLEAYKPEADDVFVCALGSPLHRKKYVEVIESIGGEFVSLIHPTALLRRNAIIGRGVVIHNYTTISCDVIIEDHVHIQGHSVIGHDCKIRQHAHLSAQVFMGGYSVAEKEAQIYSKATILPNITIGEGAIVGAGSVVIKNTPPQVTVFGVPAKKIH